MKCKTIHSKLIFFLEKELPVSEMEQVREHLENCRECNLFIEDMKKTLSILEVEKSPEINPFFYTSVKEKLDNSIAKQKMPAGNPILVRVLQPVAFSVILLLGVYGGIKIAQPLQKETTGHILTEQEMVPYLNEMAAEPIETFLME